MKIVLDKADLQPIIEAAVSEALAKLQEQSVAFGDKLAYSEADAAALLDVAPKVLGDCRRRGEIAARRVGKEYRYSRAELIKFLQK